MASGEPPPMHHRSFVQTVFDYSLWPHIGWSGLDNLLYRNGLVGRITRQHCTSPRHFWMPSKAGRKHNNCWAACSCESVGRHWPSSCPAGNFPFQDTRKVLCCSALGSMEKTAPAPAVILWLDTVRLRAVTPVPSCTRGRFTSNISTSKVLQPSFVSLLVLRSAHCLLPECKKQQTGNVMGGAYLCLLIFKFL